MPDALRPALAGALTFEQHAGEDDGVGKEIDDFGIGMLPDVAAEGEIEVLQGEAVAVGEEVEPRRDVGRAGGVIGLGREGEAAGPILIVSPQVRRAKDLPGQQQRLGAGVEGGLQECFDGGVEVRRHAKIGAVGLRAEGEQVERIGGCRTGEPEPVRTVSFPRSEGGS